ncbi:MAG: sialidase family protein [Planctomycetaceae bacterium]
MRMISTVLLAGLLTPFVSDCVLGAEPTTLFFAKADDTHVRHSEGTAVELGDGRIFFIWQEFRKGPKGDSDYYPARLVAKTSSDGGLTWDQYRVIVEIAPGDLNVFSPSLLRLCDGSILLAFIRKHDYEKPGDYYTPTSAFALISHDDAETFEPLSTIWSRKRMHLCNNTLKQLSTGRIILPSDRDNSTKENPDNWACGCVFSDDGGKTWTVSDNFTTLPKRGGMEPHIEELSDGRLLMIMRTELGAIHKSESSDGGKTWSEAETLGVESPQSCPDLLKDPATGHLVLIWNAAKYDPQWFSHQGKRTPLSAAISKDDGKTWSKPRHIESDPKRAFSNPGAFFTSQGTLFVNYWTCKYEPNGAMVSYPIDLKVAVVDSKWLYE